MVHKILTMWRISGGRTTDTETVKVEPMAGDVLLGLEHDDVDLWSEHATQDYEATQADWDAHGGGLDLWTRCKKQVNSELKQLACRVGGLLDLDV